MTLENLLITGATGQQGGAVISALQAQSHQHFRIFALTRKQNSPTSLKLSGQSINLIQGDTSSHRAIFDQLPTLHGVFLVTLPGLHEEDNASSFIDAALQAGVKHIVFTSVDRGGPVRSETDEPMLVPHFGVKRDIENHLKTACTEQKEMGKEVIWTILRPTSFMDNLAPGFVGRVAATALMQMGGTRVSLVSVKDIGRAAATAFEQPRVFGGKALTLTGDLLTFVSRLNVFRSHSSLLVCVR